jgi:hypothetical protein
VGGGVASTVVAVINIVSANFKEPCYVSSFRSAGGNETFF